MDELLMNPSFMIYCLAAVALCLNMLGLWGYSGAVRNKSKTTPNPEDASTVAKGSTVTTESPPVVARVLRAHRNATDNAVPFLILGFLYVLLGATPKMAWILFGGFTLARYCHTFFYVGGKQPWRSVAFVAGGLLTLGVMVQVARASIARLLLLMG
jgi:uncharacterized MAPEG superfamily protein